jgi:xanthine dehydrogenase accessory factor
VYVFGGGHVSQALVPLLAGIDFRCVVLEDRAQFAAPELFPDAHEIILAEVGETLKRIHLTPMDYAVVMTRGHRNDLAVQCELLRTDVGYIGVIGSRSKKEFVFGRMREAGFRDSDLARITTPIGLSIGAETPAEIAVSIAAQLIQVRAAGR